MDWSRFARDQPSMVIHCASELDKNKILLSKKRKRNGKIHFVFTKRKKLKNYFLTKHETKNFCQAFFVQISLI
uniref:Uncharacterized protein n=1 Tax=Meloidogyne enterolobii TaxID=390850 RepID=A0A6V7UT20_MELEN|nr:unnamed protein product [Meloidogyne enterolobii]